MCTGCTVPPLGTVCVPTALCYTGISFLAPKQVRSTTCLYNLTDQFSAFVLWEIGLKSNNKNDPFCKLHSLLGISEHLCTQWRFYKAATFARLCYAFFSLYPLSLLLTGVCFGSCYLFLQPCCLEHLVQLQAAVGALTVSSKFPGSPEGCSTSETIWARQKWCNYPEALDEVVVLQGDNQVGLEHSRTEKDRLHCPCRLRLVAVYQHWAL